MLGTSAKSSDITQTLQSVCHQIAVNLELSDFELPTDPSETVRTFHDLLSKATHEKPFFVFLDSLDQLSAKNRAHKLTWLPRLLPQHVHMVLSILLDLHDILNNLQTKVPPDSFVHVKSLGQNLSKDILTSWMETAKRKLTDDQQSIVAKAFESCSLPLYVKLVYEQVITWKSFDPARETVLSSTVQEVINDLFKRLEVKHGQIFVSHALAYLTASQTGLSESEWEDVLSLDDTVLKDVFQYHIPPVRRVPQVLIIRVLNDISQYIATREADNTRVLFWYHRQFIQTATSRYLTPLKAVIHKHLAEYFLGDWHETPKPFEYNDYQMKRLGLSSPSGEALRLVPAQPLMFEGGNASEKPRYNLRKLNKLPGHLLESGDIKSLKANCLFNLDFLQAKLEANGVHAVLADLNEAQEQRNEEDIGYLWKALSETRTTLNQNPKTLPIELAGRLLYRATHSLDVRKLVQQCCLKATLMPVTVCYPTPGGALIQSLEHKDLPSAQKNLVLTNHGQNLLALSAKNDLIVWELASGDVERELPLWPAADTTKLNIMRLSTNGNFLIAADAFQRNENTVVVYDIEDDCVLFAGKLDKVYKSVGFLENFAIDTTGDHILINIKNREGDVFDMKGKHVHQFTAPASSMYVTASGETVIFLLEDNTQLKFFSLASMSYWSEAVTLESQTEERLVVFAKATCRLFAAHAHTSGRHVDVISVRETSESARLEKKIDLENILSPGMRVQRVQLSEDESYLLVSGSLEIVMWDIDRNTLHRKFYIPEDAQSKYKVQHFHYKLDPSNNTLVATVDQRLVVFR